MDHREEVFCCRKESEKRKCNFSRPFCRLKLHSYHSLKSQVVKLLLQFPVWQQEIEIQQCTLKKKVKKGNKLSNWKKQSYLRYFDKGKTSIFFFFSAHINDFFLGKNTEQN